MSMGDWLKLTTEDIAAAQQQIQSAPVMPVVLKLETADLLVPPSPHTTSAAQTMRITEAELADRETAVSFPPIPKLEQLMFRLINKARQQHLPRWLKNRTLRWHTGLTAVAHSHTVDMQQRHYIDHISPEGTGIAQRLQQQGITYLACGENIGAIYETSPDRQNPDQEALIHSIHEAFMKQPRSLTNHRGNILNPIWSYVGIGIVYDELSGTLIVTQNFMSALRSK